MIVCIQMLCKIYSRTHHDPLLSRVGQLNYFLSTNLKIKWLKSQSYDSRLNSTVLFQWKNWNSVPIRNLASSRVKDSIWFVVVALFIIIWRSNAGLIGAKIQSDSKLQKNWYGNIRYGALKTYQLGEIQSEVLLTVPSYNWSLFDVE